MLNIKNSFKQFVVYAGHDFVEKETSVDNCISDTMDRKKQKYVKECNVWKTSIIPSHFVWWWVMRPTVINMSIINFSLINLSLFVCDLDTATDSLRQLCDITLKNIYTILNIIQCGVAV